jgi:hypothetical protein
MSKSKHQTSGERAERAERSEHAEKTAEEAAEEAAEKTTEVAGSGNGTRHPDSEFTSPNLRRAEEIVDQVAERMARFTSVAGRTFLRWGARVREEAEDIWAEAQVVRRGKKP